MEITEKKDGAARQHRPTIGKEAARQHRPTLMLALALGLWLLAGSGAALATTHTEFYTDASTGGNTNAGSTTGTNVYTSINGNWDGTSVFTPVDGSTPANNVSVGMWASIRLDGADPTVSIRRITVVAAGVNGAITVSTLAGSGTVPTSGATGRSITVGGVWKGPNGASGFPFSFITLAATNTSYDRPRVNFKNNAEYTVSAGVNQANAGPLIFQGYSSSTGDGGRAVLTGNGVGAAIALLTLSGAQVHLADFIIRSNGTSSTALGLSLAANNQIVERVTVNKIRGIGIQLGATGGYVEECEAFDCGGANTALDAGFRFNSGASTVLKRCISHDNTNANIAGFSGNASAFYFNCIADSNGTNGFTVNASSGTTVMDGCDSYNNGGHGFENKGTAATASAVFIENCNFIKNGGYGLSWQVSNSNCVGVVQYFGLGSGSQANTLGTVDAGSTRSGGVMIRDGTSITYASGVTPWVDPANGDFRVNLQAARNVGRGEFTQSSASYGGTTNAVDVGAAEILTTSGAAVVFAQ